MHRKLIIDYNKFDWKELYPKIIDLNRATCLMF